MGQQGTYSGCRAKIQQDLTLFKEAILLIQLDKLERSSSPVPFLFCEFVPLIQTPFAMLLQVSFCRISFSITGEELEYRTFFWMAIATRYN